MSPSTYSSMRILFIIFSQTRMSNHVWLSVTIRSNFPDFLFFRANFYGTLYFCSPWCIISVDAVNSPFMSRKCVFFLTVWWIFHVSFEGLVNFVIVPILPLHNPHTIQHYYLAIELIYHNFHCVSHITI